MPDFAPPYFDEPCTPVDDLRTLTQKGQLMQLLMFNIQNQLIEGLRGDLFFAELQRAIDAARRFESEQEFRVILAALVDAGLICVLGPGGTLGSLGEIQLHPSSLTRIMFRAAIQIIRWQNGGALPPEGATGVAS
jgi:hypothetical protein